MITDVRRAGTQVKAYASNRRGMAWDSSTFMKIFFPREDT